MDLYRADFVLIQEHSDEVDMVVAQRANRCLETGDMVGSAVWETPVKAMLSAEFEGSNSSRNRNRATLSDPDPEWTRPVFVATRSVGRKESMMSKTGAPYPPEFWQQMVALVRSRRTPGELARAFEPSAQAIRNTKG